MALAAADLAALAALFTCAFLIMLYHAWGFTIGAWLQLIAGVFDRVRTPKILGRSVGLGVVGDAIRGLDHDMRNLLGRGIAATEHGFHLMMHWQAYLWTQFADTVADLAEATLRRFEHMTRVAIPNWVTHRLASIVHRISALEHEIEALPHRAEIVIRKPIQVVYREAHKAVAAAGALTLPKLGRLEREADALAGRIGRLGRTLEADAAKLTRLNRATLATAAVGIVAVALARLGLGSLRCSNTRRAAKQLCGMDGSLLDSLLADTVVIFGTVSLVEFARGMQDGTDEIAGAVRAFWRA